MKKYCIAMFVIFFAVFSIFAENTQTVSAGYNYTVVRYKQQDGKEIAVKLSAVSFSTMLELPVTNFFGGFIAGNTSFFKPYSLDGDRISDNTGFSENIRFGTMVNFFPSDRFSLFFTGGPSLTTIVFSSGPVNTSYDFWHVTFGVGADIGIKYFFNEQLGIRGSACVVYEPWAIPATKTYPNNAVCKDMELASLTARLGLIWKY